MTSRAASFAPNLVLAAGVLFVLALLATIPAEVFFNGDAGVKFLLTRQFSEGETRVDLALPAPEWARTLWDGGDYPFHPPFVYEIGEHRYAQYPIWFPLLSAPFYQMFGFRGLYLLPAIALFLHWVAFRALAARLGIPPFPATAALLALVFASPLTLYAAMFWEHTLAVALAFFGVVVAVAPPARGGRRAPIGAGILAGFSAWLRPEMAWFTLLLAALALAAPVSEGCRFRRRLFAGSMLATALASLGAGWILSGSPMGYYGIPVWRPGQKLALYPEAFAIAGENLLYYFPVVLVPPACLLLAARHWRRALAWPFGALLLVAALFIPVVSLIWPMGGGRQWGPRFLLIVVPVAALLSGLALHRLRTLSPRLGFGIGIALLAGAVGLGFVRNTVRGGDRVIRDAATRVLPALQYVRRAEEEVVAVSRQWISQDLAAALDRKVFFLTPTFADVARLAAILERRDVREFVYLALPGEPPPPPLRFEASTGPGQVGFSPRRVLGQYVAYEARIVRSTRVWL